MNRIFFTLFYIIIFFSSAIAEETYLSLKKSKLNVRYGPSFDSDIKYVYKKINLPIKQIDKKENFRRIIDLKNNSGWIHISQLKKIIQLFQQMIKFCLKNPLLLQNQLLKLKKVDYWFCKNVKKIGVRLNLIILKDGLKMIIFGA